MSDWRIELDAGMLADLVDRATQRRAAVTVIEATFGAGSTTLAEAAADRLREQGTTVLFAYASPELRDVPLGAMAALLAATGAPPDEPTSDRLHRLLVSLAPARAAAVLMVDDAQHLDDVSAAAIRQLVHGYGVHCIVTARPGATMPAPIARLDDEGLLHRIAIAALSEAGAATLIEGAIGDRIEPDSLQRLISRAAGTPLLLRGLTNAAVDSGEVHWSPAGIVVGAVPLPSRLADGIVACYHELGAEAVLLAELLAIARRLPVSVLDDRRALLALTSAGLVAVAEDVASIAHPLHTETIVTRLSVERAGELRNMAAELLSGSGGDNERFAAAVLLAHSSNPPETGEVAWAAHRANALEDRTVAIGLAERALELAAARGEPKHPGALLVRADVLSASGRHEEADAAFEEALQHATTDFDLAAAAVRGGLHFAFRRDQAERATAIWSDALARIVDPSSRAYVTTNIGKWQVMIGERPIAGVESTEHVDDPALALNPRLLQLISAIYAGDLDAARASIASGRPLAIAARDVVRHGTDLIDFGEFLLILLEARMDDALAFADVAHPDRFDEAAGLWAYGRAFALYHAGRLDEALRLATIAVDQLAWRDILGALGSATALRAAAAAQLGDLTLAGEIAATLDADARRFVTADLQVSEAESWLLASAGEEQEAIHRIEAAVRTATAAGHWCYAMMTASIAVRLGHPAIALEVAGAAGDAPVAPLARLLLAHAEALAAADPVALLAAAEALEAAGFAAAAHDAARQATEIARRLNSVGLTRRAARVRTRIAGALSPAPSSRGLESLLSPRELAVARLAADRERNREIADRLGLSLRTVENHLASAYRKLGVAGRDALRERLG